MSAFFLGEDVISKLKKNNSVSVSVSEIGFR